MLDIYKEIPLEQLCDLKSWMVTYKSIRLTEMFITLHSIKIIISIPYTLRHCKYLINMRSRILLQQNIRRGIVKLCKNLQLWCCNKTIKEKPMSNISLWLWLFLLFFFIRNLYSISHFIIMVSYSLSPSLSLFFLYILDDIIVCITLQN